MLRKSLRKLLWLGFGIIFACGVTQAQINPWPWGKELPFPWQSIQGLWESASEDQPLVFSFEVLNNSSRGPRQIKILQVHPVDLEVVATGVGIETKRVVKALMVAKDGVSYRVSVRLVKEKQSVGPAITFPVLTMQAVSQADSQYAYHLKLQKISDIPVKIMDNSERNQNSRSTKGK